MSDTSTVLTSVLDKLGNGADRIITDAEKFATEFLRRVDVVAPQVASELKKIGLYAWQVLVRQQLAEGIFYTLAGVVIPILLYMYFKLFIKKFCINERGDYIDQWDGGVTALTIILTVASLVGTAVFLFYGITHLISPEYYAVEELLEKFITQPQQR